MTQITSRKRHMSSAQRCPCCGRLAALTFHHLIPKKLHRRTRFKKHFSREELNGGIEICRQCHAGIHKRYDEMTLYKEYATPEALLSDPELSKYFAWVGRQKIQA